jgi:hypothetical protein
MTMDETKALLAEAEASGDPKRVAAALRKTAKEWQQESRVNAAVNQAKAALSLAESRWADKLSALAASASAEERNGGRRRRASRPRSRKRRPGCGSWAQSHVAKARAAVAQAE